MACICCFFDNENQINIKQQSLTEERFEEKLKEYKKNYIKLVKELVSVNECNCKKTIGSESNNIYLKFCDDFLIDFQSNIELIEILFDEVIDIYEANLLKGRRYAYNKLDEFVSKRCRGGNISNSLVISTLLFRGRPIGKYDKGNIHEYYHIPFNKREIVPNQRFSISGNPMLYLAKSLQTISSELNEDYSKINYSVYMPKYSYFYGNGFFNISNYADKTLNECIEPIINQGSIIEYDNDYFTFSKNNICRIISESILYQILTFPRSKVGVFVEEYTLPQLLTDYIKSKGYLGVIYQSSKPTKDIPNNLKYINLDYNYCFFVPYSKANYNDELLNKFYTACIGENEKIDSIQDLENSLDKYDIKLNRLKESGFNCNDYVIYKSCIEDHKKYITMLPMYEQSAYDSIKNIEITLLNKLVKLIIRDIESIEQGK